MRTGLVVLGTLIVGALGFLALTAVERQSALERLETRLELAEQASVEALDEAREARGAAARDRPSAPMLRADPKATRRQLERLESRVAELERALAARSEDRPAAEVTPKKVAAKKTADPVAVNRWIEKLEAKDNDIVFSATIELARLGDKRAARPLMRLLKEHRDFYVRLGAATALGQLEIADAVPDLIAALDERDDLVRTAASEALHRITKHDFGFRSGLAKRERLKIQEQVREWWHEHEHEVRERLSRDG